MVGGVANRSIQGQKTTGTDLAVDATVGAAFGVGGKYVQKGRLQLKTQYIPTDNAGNKLKIIKTKAGNVKIDVEAKGKIHTHLDRTKLVIMLRGLLLMLEEEEG